MTTYAEFEALVIAETRRPEIPAITQAAIKSATLRAHHTDFFPRDLASDATIVFTPNTSAVYYDIPNLGTLLARLRAIKLVQMVDNVTFAPVETLGYRTVDDRYDSNMVRRLSMYNLIGDTLRAYPQAATGRMEITFFQNPILANLTFSSWIVDTYPEEMTKWAAGIVFARSGFQEQARDYQENHVKPFKELLVASHLLGDVQ